MLKRMAAGPVSVTLLLMMATPSSAADGDGGGWFSTGCAQTPSPACDLAVGIGNHQTSNDDHHQTTGSTSGSNGDSGGPPCEWWSLGPSLDTEPFYEPSKPGDSGAWYVQMCLIDGKWGADANNAVWVPFGQAPPAPRPSPRQLALTARSRLTLPEPHIQTSPATTQLVGLPTWLWVDRASWNPRSATASVPGVSVTVTATPVSATWSLGDGATVNCQGPGTPFTVGNDPQAASPDCGHTYRESSAGRPDEAFPSSTTVRWTIAWSGGGQSGTFADMITTASAAFRVAESQAINTGS